MEKLAYAVEILIICSLLVTLMRKKQELEALVESTKSTQGTRASNKMEISAEKTKLKTNSAKTIQRGYQIKRAEAVYCNKLQSSCLR